MKKLSLISVGTLTLAFLTGLVGLASSHAQIEVSPTAYDFGDVEVGTTESMVVTVQNVGINPYEITSVEISGSSDFSLGSLSLPITLTTIETDPTNAILFITVAFTPSSVGSATAQLLINDSPCLLGGLGVSAQPPPSVTVQDILDYFDSSVADGTLFGSGPGKSADGRKKALRNMIKAAGDLIEDGYVADACQQLLDAYQRCDGLPRPPEFVAGPAAPILAGMILDLMASLGCE